jgi:tRNA/tmRNA/rRNA uracil-C5-methylase (TrmA/RlmC/RlmD family)
MLIDPPREGAVELVKALGRMPRSASSMSPAIRQRWPVMRRCLLR